MSGFWHNKRVLLTGHTGFKGGWLALWLCELGAQVQGYALAPPTTPNLFTLARVADAVDHKIADVRDFAAVRAAVAAFKPDIVFHLAAQPLLRLSYEIPVETYATNVMGAVHVMEAVRETDTAKVTLIITSDKCYENDGRTKPYRESDAMGGYDPYSSSKGCVELAVAAYGRSYFNTGKQALATARAGNVIGGGDWSTDRLMTDIMATVVKGESPVIRNPNAIRPWQHVLEPLSGYLRAVEYLWDAMPHHPEVWNFGPNPEDEVTVAALAEQVCRLFDSKKGITITQDPKHLHEAAVLKLDSTKAKQQLEWSPRWSLTEALTMTAEWFQKYQAKDDMRAVSLAQIKAYNSGSK